MEIIGNSFSASEIEFISENELIDIIPTEQMDAVHLMSVTLDFYNIQGTYGPFKPPLAKKVPLWMAITLQKKTKCRIIPPSWLEEDYLKTKLDQENEEMGFSKMPFHYMEIAHALLKYASEEIQNAEQVRALVKDIWEVREKKIQMGLASLDQHYLQMDNLGLLEINSLRPIFANGMNGLYKILQQEQEEQQEQDEI